MSVTGTCIGLVPVTFDEYGKSKVYLYQAPPFTVIEEGRRVMVDVDGIKKFARVKADCRTVDVLSSEFAWITQAFGATPTRPLKKILGVYEELEYVGE